jgi:phage minor structural protein
MFGGGEWKFDNNNATLMRSRGKNTNVSITYGKNITDITYDDNIATVYNAVYPYWFGEVDGVDTLIVPDNLIYTDNYSSFPYLKGMSLDLTSEFSTPPTQEQLRSAAESYIANNGVGTPDISIDVNFVPLWQVKGLEYLKQLEKVSLCDTVSVIVPHLNIATNAKVVETQYNVLKERYDSIKIGTVKKNFVGKISGDLNNIRSVVDQLKRMR